MFDKIFIVPGAVHLQHFRDKKEKAKKKTKLKTISLWHIFTHRRSD